MKRYPEYKESGVGWIGEIPSYWQSATIKHLTKNLDGKRIPLSGEVRADQKRIYPYYGANGVIDYVEDYIFEGEHILIGEDGAPFFDKTREVSLLASGKFWVNNHCHILKNIGTSEARFIVYCLNSVDYFEYITGSTRDKLTQADLNRIKIPVPNYQEQHQIANFLDQKTGQIDELIRIKDQRIELLQEQRTVLINQAVTKGLDANVEMKPSGVEWIGEIPVHWEVIRNKFIFQQIRDVSYPNLLLLSIGIRGIIPKSQTDQKDVSSADKSLYKRVKIGDIAFNVMTAWKGGIGMSDYEGIVSPAYQVCRPTTKLVSKYFHYLFRTDLYKAIFDSASYQVVDQRHNLYYDNFKNISAIFPPFSEQAQITNFLDRKTQQIDELISTEGRKIELLKEYRQSLIAEAVTGKIDVRNEV